jgi:hypothetical protein
MTCPNINLTEWKNLVNVRGENIAYYLWDFYKGEVPEHEYLQINTAPYIKSGVSELFESNPELANAVYEALGFKTDKKGLIELVHYSSKNINPLENFQEDYPLYTSKGENSEYKDYGKQFNFLIKSSANIKSLTDFHGKYGIDLDKHDMSSKGLQPYHFSLQEIQNIRKESVDILIDDWGEYIILNKNSVVLKEQQKQQAQQLYSKYLDTVFPDSKGEEMDNNLYISVLNDLKSQKIIDKQCS